MSEAWICRTQQQFDAFAAHIKAAWSWDVPLSIRWSKGIMRSSGQLALCHIWIRAITDYVNARMKSDHDEETMKVILKRHCGIRVTIIDPITGESTVALKSLGRYEKGELYHFMRAVEHYAADIGCILPVWGEYEELKRHESH